MTAAVRIERTHDGAVARLVLDRPKANVLDATMTRELTEAVVALGDDPALRLVVFEGAGRHFSFGASVEEHLPGRVRGMITGFHAFFRALEDLGVPTAAIVRGQCLGGGFEVATWCGMVFADPTARLAVPEVMLGVFPPIAALALGWRTTGAVATRLVTTGQSVKADEALRLGLVDDLSDDPEAALQAWIETSIVPLSGVGLRFAWRAARRPVARALAEDLPALEALYLDDLMACSDPVEGLTAFLEKRAPQWRHQ